MFAASAAPPSAQAPDEIIVKPPAAARRAPKSLARSQPNLNPVMRPVRVPGPILNDILRGVTGRERIEWARGIRADAVDLNSDGKPEFIVYATRYGFCGATGNCENWVYSKAGDSYELLLTGSNLEVQNVFTNRYRNIVSAGYMGGLTVYIDLYKFDGSQYQKKECYVRNYSEMSRKFKTSRTDCFSD